MPPPFSDSPPSTSTAPSATPGTHPARDASSGAYPENPVLVRVWRGGYVESIHRGAWCLVDTQGNVLDGMGEWDAAFFARSSVKSLQALPLCESGAAERFGLEDEELVLALASHDGEACHTAIVERMLARLGLSEADLRCGAHAPSAPDVRRELDLQGSAPGQVHNNCSGKHAGFLALALQLGVPVERYLDPESEGQARVRAVLSELTDTPLDELVPAVDGCSAPTYRIRLRGLATAFARITTPAGLAPERRRHLERMVDAAGRHPVLIGGSHDRLDTDLLRATGGRLFPKIGAEAMYAVGVRGADRGLAIKVDDGGRRGLYPLVVGLLRRLGLASEPELARLGRWNDPVLRNHAGLEVGRLEALV